MWISAISDRITSLMLSAGDDDYGFFTLSQSPLPPLRRARAHTHDNTTQHTVPTILLRRGGGGDVLAEGGADLVEDVGVDGGEVARELVAHDRDVELVVDPRAERVPELQDLSSRMRMRVCVRETAHTRERGGESRSAERIAIRSVV